MFVKNKTVHIIISLIFLSKRTLTRANAHTHSRLHAHNFNCFQVTNIIITAWQLLLRVQLLLFAAFCMSFSFLYACSFETLICIVGVLFGIGISNY